MKLLLIILIFFSCKIQKPASSMTLPGNELKNFIVQDSITYQVQKIDSINNYYIIYSYKKNEIFKIVSEKNNDGASTCNAIKVNKHYNFKLYSVFSINGKSLFPNGMGDLHAWKADKNTEIALAGTGTSRNLYFAENIRGLCFFEDK